MAQLFEKVAIIGYGLIGSSLGRAIRAYGLADKVVCVDSSPHVCETVLRLDIADSATTDPAQGVAGADLVVLAVPVGAMESVCERIAPALKTGCLVTDTGSVKDSVVRALKTTLPAHARIVAGHPIAGTEHSGPESGFPELFRNRWCILTPLPDADPDAVSKLEALWESCGSKTEIMDPRHHDLVLAVTSHLPHLIAYTIVGTATDLESHIQSEVVKFSASGFRDFTRIASSDPVTWRDVFLNNREAMLEILQRFNEDLTSLQRAVRDGNGAFLEAFFTRTRHIRRDVIAAGQAEYVYPHLTTQQGTGTPPVSLPPSEPPPQA